MKAENLMDAIGNLDEGLLVESLPAKRRNFRPLAVAAAIAAALAVTVGAGYLVIPQFFYYQNGKETQFAARTEFGGSVLSEERVDGFVTVLTEAHTAGEKGVDYAFNSLSEMEEHLDVVLLKNDRLIDRGCGYDVWSIHPSEIREDTLLITAHYQPAEALSNQYAAFVYARISTRDNAAGTLYSEATDDVQTYVYHIESIDVTATLATGVYRSASTVAYFVKDGIAYEVETFNNSVEYMYDILEGFHY